MKTFTRLMLGVIGIASLPLILTIVVLYGVYALVDEVGSFMYDIYLDSFPKK
jgi:hypothetical protein